MHADIHVNARTVHVTTPPAVATSRFCASARAKPARRARFGCGTTSPDAARSSSSSPRSESDRFRLCEICKCDQPKSGHDGED
jgi:hypothetical protein